MYTTVLTRLATGQFCGDSCDRNQAIILVVLVLVNLIFI